MFLKIETTSKKIIQPTTIKSKNNGCGTAPGNLVYILCGTVTSALSNKNFRYLLGGKKTQVIEMYLFHIYYTNN